MGRPEVGTPLFARRLSSRRVPGLVPLRVVRGSRPGRFTRREPSPTPWASRPPVFCAKSFTSAPVTSILLQCLHNNPPLRASRRAGRRLDVPDSHARRGKLALTREQPNPLPSNALLGRGIFDGKISTRCHHLALPESHGRRRAASAPTGLNLGARSTSTTLAKSWACSAERWAPRGVAQIPAGCKLGAAGSIDAAEPIDEVRSRPESVRPPLEGVLPHKQKASTLLLRSHIIGSKTARQIALLTTDCDEPRKDVMAGSKYC